MNATNFVTTANQSKMMYKMLNMIEPVHYLQSINEIMSMFDYESESIETNVFSFLLNESQVKFDTI